jgi:hypothetical protein
MSGTNNGYVCSSLFCDYKETIDVFLIAGLVQAGEILMASTIRYCRHLVSFHFTHDNRLYLAIVLNEFVGFKPIKISLFYFFLLASLSGELLAILVQWRLPLPKTSTKL